MLCNLTGQTSLASALFAAPFLPYAEFSSPFSSPLSSGFPPLFPEFCSMLSVKEALTELFHNSCLRSGSPRANTMALQEKVLATKLANQLFSS